MNIDEPAQWTVLVNEPEDGVVLEFTHLDSDGIETFCTAMSPKDAIILATAILNTALEIEGEND